jgi:hypothetical protein
MAGVVVLAPMAKATGQGALRTGSVRRTGAVFFWFWRDVTASATPCTAMDASTGMTRVGAFTPMAGVRIGAVFARINRVASASHHICFKRSHVMRCLKRFKEFKSIVASFNDSVSKE